jgi:hypothetical protein
MKIIKTAKYKKAQYDDPQNVDPETGRPYDSPSLEDQYPAEEFTERQYPGVNEGQQFVSVYEVQRAYGGPEEGGWWFDVYSLIDSVPVGTRAAALVVKKHLESKYKPQNEETGPLDSARGFERLPEGTEDYQIPRGFTGDASEIVIMLEDEPGENTTKERPHYE